MKLIIGSYITIICNKCIYFIWLKFKKNCCVCIYNSNNVIEINIGHRQILMVGNHRVHRIIYENSQLLM